MFIPSLIIAAIIVVYVVSIYNDLAKLKTQIVASIQEIGNQLKRQAALIPNLLETVKGYLKHEKSIFQMLTDARKAAQKAEKSGSSKDINEAINQIQQAVPKLSIAVEDNPELKADKTVTQFMNELTDTADKLMYARRSVIDLSQAYNAKLVIFPSNIIANLFGFKEEKGLATALTGSHVEVSSDEMKDVKVQL
ncbi:LemA family protein [Patescibacteria group bacterium]|nr:LemA family protein [Patescibacteria group bacterium]MBU1967347.1 LemA family protein [Patescibacteria group bacterium]MBU2543828.1 LemA family protein [Patescibacteria group bacterium]